MGKRYYEKGSYIHQVADFPDPKREGHTNCGLSLEGMTRVPDDVVEQLLSHQYCIKCIQLTGGR